MARPNTFKYRGYLLQCDPQPMADGRFGAQVVIARHTGDSVSETKIGAIDYFATEEEAVECAHQRGRTWVDDAS